jgi:hypothetical protein
MPKSQTQHLKVRLILSASKGIDEHLDATNTAKLITSLDLMGLTARLCIGTYKGQREIAVEVTGFADEATPWLKIGADCCRLFRQECAYYSVNGEGFLLYPNGTHEWVGSEVEADSVTIAGLNDTFTEYLNGRAMTTITIPAALAA